MNFFIIIIKPPTSPNEPPVVGQEAGVRGGKVGEGPLRVGDLPLHFCRRQRGSCILGPGKGGGDLLGAGSAAWRSLKITVSTQYFMLLVTFKLNFFRLSFLFEVKASSWIAPTL